MTTNTLYDSPARRRIQATMTTNHELVGKILRTLSYMAVDGDTDFTLLAEVIESFGHGMPHYSTVKLREILAATREQQGLRESNL